MAEGGEEKDGNLGGLPFERTIRFRKEYSSLIFRQSFGEQCGRNWSFVSSWVDPPERRNFGVEIFMHKFDLI